jgi:glycosyltransferase involved in cell wall biosynthesis
VISILIPTYNYDIRQLVRVLHAEATGFSIAFEIVVREDASIHFTSENLEIEDLANVVYLVNPINLGRSATRQLLAKEANYENLLFLDADVLPYKSDFIKKYLENLKTQVICGGITYNGVQANANQQLRYIYGSNKEQQTAVQRSKRNYIITAGNFRITKALFLKINAKLENFYGDDLLLSQNLKNEKASVLQIDNPVQHLGLETSEQFLEKSIEGVASIIALEKEDLLDTDFTKLQSVYVKLKRLFLIKPLFAYLTRRKAGMKANLLSQKPTLLYFDLYRLQHYINLKRQENA